MKNNSLEQTILEKWDSEEAIYHFLQREFKRINKECFKEILSIPRLQIKPMWLSRGLLDEHNQAGGDYKPAEGNYPATIGIFSQVLLDENETQIALAHEMVHHWEATTKPTRRKFSYQMDINKIIHQRFPKLEREKVWRISHSNRFISKACEVASRLEVPIGYFLFRFPPKEDTL